MSITWFGIRNSVEIYIQGDYLLFLIEENNRYIQIQYCIAVKNKKTHKNRSEKQYPGYDPSFVLKK